MNINDTYQNQVKRFHVHKTKGHMNPKNILDIGAHIGSWSKYMKEQLFPEANYFLVEADPDHEQQLQKTGFDYVITLLGDRENETKTFHTIDSENNLLKTGASIYCENTSIYDSQQHVTKQLQMKTLDQLLEESEMSDFQFDLIKIDVQGAEIDVLRGGHRTIARADFVMVEVSVQQYNVGAPLALDVMNHMDQIGFQMVDIMDLQYTPNMTLLQLDLLFAKKDSQIFEDKIRVGNLQQ